jgi:HlyD family secretion protein
MSLQIPRQPDAQVWGRETYQDEGKSDARRVRHAYTPAGAAAGNLGQVAAIRRTRKHFSGDEALGVLPPNAGRAFASNPAMRRTRWMLVLLVVLAAGGAGWWLLRPPPIPRYTTAPVTKGPVSRAVAASGTVNPVVTVQVGSYVSGVVAKVSCDYNTHVTKGQVCAQIDPRPYESTVDQDEANLAAARAQLRKDQSAEQYAQLTFDRNRDLRQRGLVSQDVLDQSKAAADQAHDQVALDTTTVAQRQAALSAAHISLDYTKIVSPVDGTVVSRNVTEGQTVAASFQTPTLFLIATDLTKMQVDTNVSESDIGNIRDGTPATFTVEAYPSRTFRGNVSQVRQAPQTVQNVVTYDVVVSAANPGDVLKPGMTATVKIITAERQDALRVPDQALRYTPGGVTGSRGVDGTGRGEEPVGTTGSHGPGPGSAVWVLRQGKPVRVPVTVGLDDNTNAEIVNGDIQPGDRVILSEQSGAQASGRGRESAPRLRF